MVDEKEKEKIVNFWSEECKKVDERPRYCNFITIKLFDKILPDVKGKKILDIGCGHDVLMDYLTAKGAKITGVDICSSVVKEMKQKGFNVIEADCCNLPFKDNTFDAVFSIGVVEHFEETEKAIKEHIRVAKKGGKVIVVVPNLTSPFFFGASLYHLLTGDLFKYGKRVVDGKYFTKGDVKKMMAGCSKVDIFSYSTSSILRPFTKTYNKKMADIIEENPLNKHFGFLLFAIGTK